MIPALHAKLRDRIQRAIEQHEGGPMFAQPKPTQLFEGAA